MNSIRNSIRQLVTIIRYPKVFLLSKRTGSSNFFGPGGRFFHHRGIYFGDNVYIGPDFHISGRNLRLGNGILIGPNVLIECDDHVFDTTGKLMWEMRNERVLGYISIEDDVWIGGNVTILKNVTIGEGCIVGAGSVVTKSLPPYTICLGTPCHPVKARFSEKHLFKHLSSLTSNYTIAEIISKWMACGIFPKDLLIGNRSN